MAHITTPSDLTKVWTSLSLATMGFLDLFFIVSQNFHFVGTQHNDWTIYQSEKCQVILNLFTEEILSIVPKNPELWD